MYVQLMRRHRNVQRPVKWSRIPVSYERVVLGPDQINENLLLQAIPAGFLPTEPKWILVTVANEQGSRGQRGLRVFHTWARFFDCYILELWDRPPHR